jgi:hypothetical protein
MSIVEAMANVMADVQSVAKKDRNEHQKFNFRGIDAVVNAVGPALRQHGVVVVPSIVSVDYDSVSTTTGKPATACRVVVTYTFCHGDSSLAATVAAEAWDAGDKAAPKAMSVAFRTALLQALALPTDEPDPDSQTYERSVPTDHKAEIIAFLTKKKVPLAKFGNWLGQEGFESWADVPVNQRDAIYDGITKGVLLDDIVKVAG